MFELLESSFYWNKTCPTRTERERGGIWFSCVRTMRPCAPTEHRDISSVFTERKSNSFAYLKHGAADFQQKLLLF